MEKKKQNKREGVGKEFVTNEHQDKLHRVKTAPLVILH